jgi:hypothetical protein
MMVQYKDAVLALLASLVFGQPSFIHASSSVAFIANNKWKGSATISRAISNSRRYSAIPYDERSSSFDSLYAEQEQERRFGSTGLLNLPDDDEEAVDALLAKKEERRMARERSMRKPIYQITLPIVRFVQPPIITSSNDDLTESSNIANGDRLASLVAKGQDIANANTVGMSLRQVYSGRRLSELALDIDTLRFQSFIDELQGRSVLDDENEDFSLGSLQVLQNSVLKLFEESFDGVVVSSVTRGGLAWQAGVRAGDVLAATSATMGSKLWPKSTLDGVRSAISSRKVISPSMDFEFRRLTLEKAEAESVQSFELSLSRPIGINVEGECHSLSFVLTCDRVLRLSLRLFLPSIRRHRRWLHNCYWNFR